MDKLNTLARPNILMHRLLQDALVIAKAAALVDVSTTRVWSFLNYYGPGTNFNNYVSIEIQRVNFLFRFQAHANMTIVTKFNMTVVARAIFCCNMMAWDAALPILPIYLYILIYMFYGEYYSAVLFHNLIRSVLRTFFKQ